MQLKNRRPRTRHKLIAASCALPSATAARAQQDLPDLSQGDESGTVIVDTALGYYQESGGRIQAVEPVISSRKDYGDGRLLDLDFTYDSLSGATPNGALTSDSPQTFSSPSGTSLSATPQTYTTASGTTVTRAAPIYTVPAGELPMDPNFRDQRIAADGSFQYPLTPVTNLRVGGGLSHERDFFSLTANAAIARDFNQKNTTLSLGVNDEYDSVRPVGGAPLPGSDYALFDKTGGKNKNGVGVMLGMTQIMNRRWIAQLNLTATRFSGYLNDPYKIVSIVDFAGDTTGYLYEKRPASRTEKVAYLENRLGFSRGAARLSLRYMADDWGIRSDTAEFSLRFWNPERDRYVEPLVRWYRQTAADFYSPWISTETGQYGSDVSADSRLSAFRALTYGLKYVQRTTGGVGSGGSEFSLRLQYYRQTEDNTPAGPGSLAGLDLYPGLKSVMLQVGWRFGSD